MKVAVFSTKPYDQQCLTTANENLQHPLELIFHEAQLNERTALLAQGCKAVCCFVNDHLNETVLQQLADMSIGLVALRCAGFNQVDLDAAKKLGIKVARVAEYSPHAIAEHALGLILMLNRNLHRAFHRVRENDYSLNGLLGFDLVGKTVGVIGTGKIGQTFARLMLGLGCEVVAFDTNPDPALAAAGVSYMALDDLWPAADIISLHCPLNTHTHHLINASSIAQMKPGVMLINTSRGGLIDTRAVIDALKNNTIGYLGLDVYEEEGDLFFENKSNQLLQDDIFARLLTFPNVVITGHQAFFTREALATIAQVTLDNIRHFDAGEFSKMVLVS
ncbi:2-hydroxyacid dehydrogenase [Cellvibrio sp. NN19]|uniref:2-hydroxyacid dehydrogenase n=1 Tax=Cellvibrio chitinivorans TaxID=3102792 RepID=UPI002B41208F|nr:2-hydroxyacid dehydrogenase [Cellvibrio sp. NN19]